MKVSQELLGRINAFLMEYGFYLGIGIAIGVMTGILAFIVLFVRLGAYSSNSSERSRVFGEMMAVAVCTALLGGVGLFGTMFYATFSG